MAGGVPTVPRLLLGEAIRRLRHDSGKTLDDAAAAIGKNRVQLIRVIDGKGTISAHDLGVLLDFLDAGPAVRRELLALGVQARKRSSRRPYSDALPSGFHRVADLESVAVQIWDYSRGVIPGLLQIPEYIEAEMSVGDGIWWDAGSSWEERRNRIDFRLARQRQVLTAEPAKTLRFLISEEALRTSIGGPEIMTAQLAYLTEVIDRDLNITIRVISSTIASNPAPVSGLILFHLKDPLPPIGLMPVSYGPSTYFDDPVDTQRMSQAFARLEELALSVEQSREVIVDLATRSTDR